jgi:hypothetical protein
MPNLKPSPPPEVRKHVSAVHVSGELSALERKLVNVLLLNAFDKLTTERIHSIPVPVLCELVGFNSNNMTHLKAALKRIMSTVIEYDVLGDGAKRDANWEASAPVSYAGITKGVCRYQYTDWLAQNLANPDIYAIINISVQRLLSSSYAIALYENCLRFRGANGGSTGWRDVAVWRKLLGAESSHYDDFKRFSSKCLKPAIKEINDASNIYVTAEYERVERKVTRIRFLVEEPRQASILDAARPSDDEIKATDAYKRLTTIGIGARLAIEMIQRDPARALETALYVEEKGDTVGNKIGYAKVVFGGTGPLVTRKRKAAPTPAPIDAAEAEKDAAADKARRARAALTPEQWAALAAEFIEQKGAKTYSAATGKFKGVEVGAFNSFVSEALKRG